MIYCKVVEGYVADRVVFDGKIPGDWPDASSFVASDEAQIGWSYSGGVLAPPEPPTPNPPSIDDYRGAIQSLVDQTAASKQFNDGVTLASYKDSTVIEWAAQSAAFIAWRDAVWIYCYAELAKVQAGARPQPTLADFLAELPTIGWPDAA